MAKRTTDIEVLEYLLSDPGTPSAVDLLTFARYAQDKRIWLNTFKEENGQEASKAEIDAWVGNWTNSQFDRLKAESQDFFDEAARIYVKDDIEAAKASVRQEIIIREVKAAGSWPRQLLIALVTGLLTPLILAALLFLLPRHLPDPNDIVNGKILPNQQDHTARPAPPTETH